MKINISEDYEIQTDTNGFFDTQLAVPALGRVYLAEAFDPTTGLRGRASIGMTPGITNFVDVHLLTRNSSIQVTVLRGNGQPASGAMINLDQGSYPNDARLTTTADASGQASFSGLWEGNYALSAEYSEGATRVFARAGGAVGPNETRAFTMRLGATGSIEGTFVKRDRTTPIEGAQVAIGNLGFANSDSNGFFSFIGVPLGTYVITSADPVTGAGAATSAALSYPDQVQVVQLIEALRGEVSGFVLDSYGAGYVGGATVRINYSDGSPQRTVTTAPNGQFAFPGSPMGNFTLSANYTMPGSLRDVSGTTTGSLTEASPTVSADVALQPLAILPVRVVRSDGTSPAPNTSVTLGGFGGGQTRDTDATGNLFYADLPLANYTLTAVSRNGGELRNGQVTLVTVALRGANPVFTVVLPGVGRVEGTVVGSDGTTAIQNAEVRLTMQNPPFGGVTDTALTDVQGRFAFPDIAVGSYSVTAASGSLAASLNGAISAAGEVDTVNLRLGDSGSLVGKVVRADGTTPVSSVDVVIDYDSQSLNPGRVFFRTGVDGAFRFDNVPVGAVHLSSVAALFGGIIDTNTALATNGQVLDLGHLRFDEDLPAVVQVTPPDTSIEQPITTVVELLFSEALATNSIRTNGIFIRSTSGTVASAVTLVATNDVQRLVRIAPLAPLVSERTYEIVVLAGDLPGPGGTTIGSGPRDLVGRAMAAPFVSHFMTADNDPPVLLSLFPSNNAVQIDPRAVSRLSFNETLRSTGFVFRVTGPGGVDVPGTAGAGVNGQVLSFVPTGELLPNALYSLTVSNVFDLAGNRATAEPFRATFATLDTIGPTIATLQIVSNAPPVAGATVQLEALLANTNEPDASVRYTMDFQPLGTATNAPFQIGVPLPQTGSTTIRAIATDQFGNDGPLAELTLAVQVNQPPTIQFTRVSPTNGPAPSGSTVVVEVAALDDSGIAQLKVLASGLGAGGLLTTNVSLFRVLGQVPPNAGPGFVQIFAEATDSIGQSSGQQVLDIPISDATAPTLAVLAPAADTIIEPGAVVPVTIQLGDNFGVTNVTLSVAGGFTASLQFPMTPVLTNGNRVLDLPVPANAPTNGELAQLTLTARDAAGNVSSAVTRLLRMPDRVPPLLASATPTNGATRQSLWLSGFAFEFDQPLDPLTTTNNVVVTNSAGAATPFTVSLANGNRQLQVALQHPLAQNATYTNVLLPGLADGAGNRWMNSGGATVPQGGVAFTFATASILSTTPTNGTRFLAGQTVPVNVTFEPGLGAGFFRFQMNSNAPVQVALPANTTNVTAQVLIPSNAPTAVLSISASDTAAFNEPLALAPITLNLTPIGTDTDGDGMPDAWEIAHGLDPFVNDASLDPDTDGLVNAQEFLAGTDPHNADTDGDGLPDGTDPDPLHPSLEVRPTELTFDIGGIGDAQNVNPDYGDGVTNHVMGGFAYGGANPFTPNVTVDYGSTDPALWTTGYGTLTNVLFEDQDGSGVLTITLTADTGFLVNLHRFDLAAYAASFASDPVVTAVQVLNEDGTAIFAATNQAVSRTAFTPIEFTPALSDNVLTIRVDARNLGSLNDDIAVDNIRFSQGFSSNRPPVIQFTNSIEVVQGQATNLNVGATDVDGNLRRLEVREWSEDTNVRLFDRLQFAQSGSGDFASPTNVTTLNTTLSLQHSFTNSTQFTLRAVDSEGLVAIQIVTVVTLPDRDGDGTADRDDADMDGDGLPNAQELTLGTDPRQPDTDGDGLSDSEELAAGVDGFVTDPLKSDTDNDGVSDGLEIALGLNPTNGLDVAGGTIVVSNRTVTVAYGVQHAGTLILTNGAVLTHADPGIVAGLLGEPRLELIVGNLVIDGTSRIDVSSRGYLGGRSGANSGTQEGRTFGNVAGSTSRNGGSYGGIGGFGNTQQAANPAYGAFNDPNELGSGGGSDAGTGGSGGGLVRIRANTVTLDGQILANGGTGGYTGGGGSGGGIRITAGTLTGAGRIQSNGGSGDGNSGDGGGGRVALYWTNAASFTFTNVQAIGGRGGFREGTPGTIFRQSSSQPGELIIDGARTNLIASATPLLSLAGQFSTALDAYALTDRRASFIPGSLIGLRLKPNTNSPASFRIVGNSQSRIFTDPADGLLTSAAAVGNAYGASLALGSVAIRNGATVELVDGDLVRSDRRGWLATDNLELNGRARLTQPLATTSSQSGVELLIADTLTVDATSLIDVSARGYLGGRSGANAANQPGRTLGNDFGSTRRNGGSYGGLGATGNTEQTVNGTYGSYADPNETGSGGGSDAGTGGNGGGLVRITANRVILDGMLLANGGDGGYTGGGGSGGGIKINTDSFTGVGTLRANGGSGDGNSGGGGGGRIAIYCNSSTGFDFTGVSVNGGSGRDAGGVGTALIKQGSTTPLIVIRSSGRETPLPVFNGEHLLLDGAIVSAGNLNLASLTLTNGAVLTHAGAGISDAYRLEINVGALTISSNSLIDVSGRGYLGGRSGENGGNSGRTLGNTSVGGSLRRNGGSYGGLGAFGNTEQPVNAIYGAFGDPNELGSGGGSDGSPAGSGGGLVRITATSVALDGRILANGGNGGFVGGGGSGGGIKIVTATLAGAGVVQANGGNGDNNSGGGGGGRIAIYYNTGAGLDPAELQANGGGGLNIGGPGTIYMKQGASVGQVVIRSSGRETPLSAGMSGEHLLIDGATVSATNMTLVSLTLTNSAVLTHAGAGVSNEYRLEINVGALTISSDSLIDVSGRGYLGGRSGENSGNSGRTLGNTSVGGSLRRNGGSYGGLGAFGNIEQSANAIYGAFGDPNELGSGGGSDGSPAGSGGGLVRITATSIALDGRIQANGGDGGFVGGGGSGGGIKIVTAALAGAGVVQANGGNGDNNSGGGGGGRIAIYFNTGAGLDPAKAQSKGGGGVSIGGPGTIYTKQGTALGQVVIRGAGRETPLSAGMSGEHLLIDGATVAATNVTMVSLTLTNAAVLTHTGAGISNEYRLEINAEALAISSNSLIDVSGRGYLGGRSGDNDGNSGRTLGNTTVGGSLRRNGGSYGGLGAFGNIEQSVNAIYGASNDPNEVGSGGGSDGSPAGNGGGLVRITATSVALDGRILANGGNGGFVGGGGSGGGIKIVTATLTGSGQVQANGGSGDNNSGGGGGGRVAIYYQNDSTFAFGNLAASGGVIGFNPGSNGTVFRIQTNFVPSQLPGLNIAGPLIYDIQVGQNSAFAPRAPSSAGGSEVLIKWFGGSGRKFALENSPDLLKWTESSAVIRETSAGRFEASTMRPDGGHGFFRVKLLPTLPGIQSTLTPQSEVRSPNVYLYPDR